MILCSDGTCLPDKQGEDNICNLAVLDETHMVQLLERSAMQLKVLLNLFVNKSIIQALSPWDDIYFRKFYLYRDQSLQGIRFAAKDGKVITYIYQLIECLLILFFAASNSFVEIEKGFRGARPCHLFDISGGAIKGMTIDKQAQCIIVNGESGSGKTESVKLMLKHISELLCVARDSATSIAKTV